MVSINLTHFAFYCTVVSKTKHLRFSIRLDKNHLLNFTLLEFSKVSEGSLILQTSYTTVLLTISILTSFLHKFNTNTATYMVKIPSAFPI